MADGKIGRGFTRRNADQEFEPVTLKRFVWQVVPLAFLF